MCSSFAALQKTVDRYSGGRGGYEREMVGCVVCDQSWEVVKLGGCSCYGELHAYLCASPEAQSSTGIPSP